MWKHGSRSDVAVVKVSGNGLSVKRFRPAASSAPRRAKVSLRAHITEIVDGCLGLDFCRDRKAL